MKSAALFLILASAPFWLAQTSKHGPPRGGEFFQRPERIVSVDGRISPNPAWVTVKWDPAADVPFKPIQKELEPFRSFRGFDNSGEWPKKAREAYRDWLIDCQNPVKLYRACGYLGVANALDQRFAREADYQKMFWDLNIGWEVLRNPPKSYLFVRMGYRMNAGDGDRHIFGDLARELLKRDPLDRTVAIAAGRELWDDRTSYGKPQSGKGAEFESFVISSLMHILASPYWRPWDDHCLSLAHFTRALRTLKRSDLKAAKKYNQDAINNSPKSFDASRLLTFQDQIDATFRLMKFD